MANWIPGQGFFLVQPSEPYDEAKLEQEMNALKLKLDAAEMQFRTSKERTA